MHISLEIDLQLKHMVGSAYKKLWYVWHDLEIQNM